MTADVRRFVEDIPLSLRRVVKSLRKQVLSVVPRARESVVWGSLSYHDPALGGRVKGSICLITPKPDHVELGFIHGSLMRDARGMLVPSGKHKRVLRLNHVLGSDERRVVSALLQEALKNRP